MMGVDLIGFDEVVQISEAQFLSEVGVQLPVILALRVDGQAQSYMIQDVRRTSSLRVASA